MRLRRTAFPASRETTNPTRAGPGRPGDRTTTMAPWRLLLPVRRTLRKSRVNLSVSGSDGDALPALATAGLDDGATGAGAHAMSETVTTSSPANFWLIGPLHDVVPGEQLRLRIGQALVKARTGCGGGVGGYAREN